MTLDKEKAIEILKTVQDPEINIDIHTLGLIYNIDFNEQTSKIKILMTFTTPFCPFGDLILEEIKQKLKDSGFRDVEIELTFEPLWQPTNEVKEILGIN